MSNKPSLTSPETVQETTGGLPSPYDNVHNLRDLGGLRSKDGRRVRAGRLLRSGNPGLASAADIQKLAALGIDVVIDFRSAAEKSADENNFSLAFNWMPLPIFEGGMNLEALTPRLLVSTPDEMHEFMLQVYRDFPLKHGPAFGQFIREAQAGRTLLFHCAAGKDRTGFASLLLLSALDVGMDDILANYLESNQANQWFIDDLLKRLEPLGVSPEVAMPLLEVRPEYLRASMQAIEQEWGSTATFLNDVLGVDCQKMRDHYLE